MRSRWSRGFVALAAALPVVACNAIFGIQDLSDNTTGPDGSTGTTGPDGSAIQPGEGGTKSPDGSAGGNDGGGPDSPGTTSNGDGGLDATVDAAPPVLSCTSWANATPITLEDLSVDGSPQTAFVGELYVGEGTANQVQIVAGRGSGQRIYTYDKSSNATSIVDDTGIALGGGEAFLYAHPYSFDAGAGAIIVDQLSTRCGVGCGHVNMDYAILPAAGTADGGPPEIDGVGGPTNETLSLASASAIPFANGAVYSAFSAAAGSSYTMYVDNTDSDAGGPVAASSAIDDDFQFPALVHAGSNVFLFSSNGPTTPGAAVYTLADDGLVSGTTAPRAFSSGVTARFSDVATSASGTSTNFAYYETGDAGVTIYAGTVPSTALATVTSSSLVNVRTYAQPTQVPVSGARAEWYGDDIMFLGAGTGSDGGARYGANLLWVDANGYVRAEQIGMNEVLGDREGIVEIVAAPSSVASTSARWDVAWIEQRGATQVLLYNQLICN